MADTPAHPPFSVRMAVRSYELDALGHLNQAVYHSYAEHARVEFFVALGGGTRDVLTAEGLGAVLLESRARYRKELRNRQDVDVSCTMSFGDGKAFWMNSLITRPDGTVAAEIDCTMGLMDLTARKLVGEPRKRIMKVVAHPEMILDPVS